jgi:glucosamine--fructose-6-phosphate aminotransferase (isomerizing)
VGITEKAIFEQFALWEAAPHGPQARPSVDYVVVGCGSSYNLAMSVAASLNEKGFGAIAVPGNEWARRPGSYKADPRSCEVIAISRSGESSELVQAARKSRSYGLSVIAITCDDRSSLVVNADRVLSAKTHAEEGIVMTASASLMLLLGLRFAGIDTEGSAAVAEALLRDLERHGDSFLVERTHFVYLGGGALYGVAAEGALKLQEMSCTVTQTYHPLEYRHGPISVIDDRSIIVMLYHPDTREEEERLAKELSAKGAFVLGFGGAGDLSFSIDGPAGLRGLVCLPALQFLGAQLAHLRDLDTTAPRHLTKVVKIG